MLDLETQRLTQYSTEKIEERDGQLSLEGRIDVSSMAKTLEQMSVAQRLGIPAYLTVDLEVRGDNTSRESLKTGKDSTSTKETPGNDRNHTGGAKGKEATTNDDGNEATGDEDDDLDAWLDSVIT